MLDVVYVKDKDLNEQIKIFMGSTETKRFSEKVF